MPGFTCPASTRTSPFSNVSRVDLGSSRRLFGQQWPALAALLAILALALGTLPAGSLAQSAATPEAPGPDPALIRAVDYLLGQQGEDGGFLGLEGEPDPGITIDAVFALKAAGQRGVDTAAAIDRALVYLEAAGGAYAEQGAGQTAKLALAVIAGGKDPLDFGEGRANLVAGLTAPPAMTSATPLAGPASLYGESVFNHALVLLAMSAAGEPVPDTAIAVLRETQLEDGAWGFAGTVEPGSGDSNTTALVIQALVATGNGTDPMVDAALSYLNGLRTELGQVRFDDSPAAMADANSTALTVQALIATGQDPSSAEWGNVARGLAAFQNVSGGFRYVDAEPGDNLLATVQAIPALAGYALPVATACDEAAAPAAISATPVIVELPAPGRGQAPCVPLAPAA